MSLNNEEQTITIDCSNSVSDILKLILNAIQCKPRFLELKKNGEILSAREALQDIESVSDDELKFYLEQVVKLSHEHKHHYWLEDETPVGQVEAKAYVLRNKNNFELYCEILQSMDLNHEVEVADDIMEIVEEWADEPELLQIIAAYATLPSQFGLESQAEFLSSTAFFEQDNSIIELYAKYLMNGHSYASYSFDTQEDFDTSIWETMTFEDLAEELNDEQKQILDTNIRRGFKALNSKGFECGYYQKGLWHQLD